MRKLMPIEHIEDWEQRIARQDAFWRREIIDRPVVIASMGKAQPDPRYPAPPQKTWATIRGRWFDAEYIAQSAAAGAMNTEYLGDALPSSWPNLGPEIFSAFFGAEIEFGDSTSWSVPNLKDWTDADKIQLSTDNIYWKKLEEITDALLQAGKGKFYTGMADWHPGGDALAAFRDPLNLNIDMIEHPDEVKALLDRITQAYFEVYDYWHNKLAAAGQATYSWPGIVSSKKWYVPSNDFSCMVSKKMFDDVFLPGIAEECRFLEASIYHLDGPQALRHLDSLLSIPELNAIQWVPGVPGATGVGDWMHIYKKCQAAGKGLQIGFDVDDLEFVMENLRPEGLWIGISGFKDRDGFNAVLKRIAKWK